MIKSMTGFASLTRDGEAATVTVTVKGVNHRFLDLQLRMPSALAPVESRLRALVQQKAARGRIELAMTVQGAAATEAPEGATELDELQRLFLFSRSDTIYGGSNEIQRDIIARRMLGLPRS